MSCSSEVCRLNPIRFWSITILNSCKVWNFIKCFLLVLKMLNHGAMNPTSEILNINHRNVNLAVFSYLTDFLAKIWYGATQFYVLGCVSSDDQNNSFLKVKSKQPHSACPNLLKPDSNMSKLTMHMAKYHRNRQGQPFWSLNIDFVPKIFFQISLKAFKNTF